MTRIQMKRSLMCETTISKILSLQLMLTNLQNEMALNLENSEELGKRITNLGKAIDDIKSIEELL